MRYSSQRETILNIVLKDKSHPTADSVFKSAKLVHPNISLGTIYRNLKLLDKNGYIKVIYDDSVVRYDSNTEHHSHLKCIICNKIIDIQLDKTTIIENIQNDFKFIARTIDITITGECKTHN